MGENAPGLSGWAGFASSKSSSIRSCRDPLLFGVHSQVIPFTTHRAHGFWSPHLVLDAMQAWQACNARFGASSDLDPLLLWDSLCLFNRSLPIPVSRRDFAVQLRGTITLG